jgi:hypothetical protein
MDARLSSSPTDYITSSLASYEHATTLAIELRLMEFSPHAVAFELNRYHGFTPAEAARIVREAAARDDQPNHAPWSSAATGARDGRRWLDLSGASQTPNG